MMRKIDMISTSKFILKKIWLPAACAVLGAAGMWALKETPAPVYTTTATHSIRLMNAQDPDSYAAEQTLAGALTYLLNNDKNLQNLAENGQCGYTCSAQGRRLIITVSADNAQHIENFLPVISEKAAIFLNSEFAASSLVQESVENFAPEEQISKKKYIMLGALLGLCVGLGALLLVQYAKSPKAAE